MKRFTGSGDYVASKELMNAVNVAIALEKPLLIKGMHRASIMQSSASMAG